MPIRAFEHAWNSRWRFAVGSGSDHCLVQHGRNGNRANLAFWEGKTFRGYSWRGQKIFVWMRDGGLRVADSRACVHAASEQRIHYAGDAVGGYVGRPPRRPQIKNHFGFGGGAIDAALMIQKCSARRRRKGWRSRGNRYRVHSARRPLARSLNS